jgi:1,4-alpha-glucan branching enzyme
MKKQYLKSKPVCKVTFSLPGQAIGGARTVDLVGEFNGWELGATPLKRTRDGSYSVTLELETGREYQFRYVVDSTTWVNDGSADRYVRSPFGGAENCVVVVDARPGAEGSGSQE